MKITLLLPPKPDASWTLAVQGGVRFAVTKAAPSLSGLAAPFELDALRQVQQRFAEAGLTLVGLEGDQFDMSRIKLGQPGRQEDVERYCRMLENMAALGINLLCYNFMARLPGQAHDWSRTRIDLPTRGGALTTAFNLAQVPIANATGGLTAEQLWKNYQWFIERVMPHAQRVDVKMALHPDDPPVPVLGGMARIFGTMDAFHRAYEVSPCPCNAVTFCQANFMLMPGDVAAHAKALAKRIAFVHWRDVAGTATDFHETFHDDGPHDMVAMIKLYHQLGFTGPIRLDHAPLMHGEPEAWMPGYGIHGRLLGAAYLRGIARGLGIAMQ